MKKIFDLLFTTPKLDCQGVPPDGKGKISYAPGSYMGSVGNYAPGGIYPPGVSPFEQPKFSKAYKTYFRSAFGVLVCAHGDWIVAVKILCPSARKYSKSESIALNQSNMKVIEIFDAILKFAKEAQ